MKTKFTLVAILFAAFFSGNAQMVPNPSFDNWASQLTPDNWMTYDSLFGAPLGLATKDGVDKIVGPYSLKLTSDSIQSLPNYGVVAAVVSLGSGSVGLQGPVFTGIPFAFKPDTLYFGYKYSSPATDTAAMSITMKKNGVGVFTFNATTVGLYIDTTSQWSLVYTVLTGFYTGPTPDTLGLKFYSSNRVPVKGSTLHIDAVLFGYVNLPSALQEVADKLNITVYPNPATDMISISTDENTDGFRVVISDISGKIVSVNNLEAKNTQIKVAEFSSGTYIYRVADKAGNILKQDRFTVVR